MLGWASGCVSASLSMGRVSREREGASESEWTPSAQPVRKLRGRETDAMTPSDIQLQYKLKLYFVLGPIRPKHTGIRQRCFLGLCSHAWPQQLCLLISAKAISSIVAIEESRPSGINSIGIIFALLLHHVNISSVLYLFGY